MKRTQTASRSGSVSQGPAAVEPEAGTLVVYAVKDGETALDGDGINSPFASAFVKNLPTPGLEVRRLFDFVRDDVMEATGRKQKPFSYGSISGRRDFYFVAGVGNVAPRVVFPPLHQNGSPPPVASVSPTAPGPATAANGATPNNEPHRIKTLAVKGDASENGGIPAAPQLRPPDTAQPANSPGSGPVAAVAHTGWIIQVGALESESDARARIDLARNKARGLLGKAHPFTELVVAQDNRKLFRVRFAGLERDQAEQVCRTLKRADISCITVSPF